MSETRDPMIQSLRKIVIPSLKAKGFKGTFPHFRRISDTRIDLLSFQFDRYGGGFVIEIGKCSPEGITTPWGEQIPPLKVKVYSLHPNERIRVQPVPGGDASSWFRYD